MGDLAARTPPLRLRNPKLALARCRALLVAFGTTAHFSQDGTERNGVKTGLAGSQSIVTTVGQCGDRLMKIGRVAMNLD